jgi:hypothetical protein
VIINKAKRLFANLISVLLETWRYLVRNARWRERFYVLSTISFLIFSLMAPIPSVQKTAQPLFALLVGTGVFALILETYDWLKNSSILRNLLLVVLLPILTFFQSAPTATQMLYSLTQVPPLSFTRATVVMTLFATAFWVAVFAFAVAMTASLVFGFLSIFAVSQPPDKTTGLIPSLREFFEQRLGYKPNRNTKAPVLVATTVFTNRGASLLIGGFLIGLYVLPTIASLPVQKVLTQIIVQVEYLEPTHCKLPPLANSQKETRKIAFTSDGKISVATPNSDGYVFSVMDKCN